MTDERRVLSSEEEAELIEEFNSHFQIPDWFLEELSVKLKKDEKYRSEFFAGMERYRKIYQAASQEWNNSPQLRNKFPSLWAYADYRIDHSVEEAMALIAT